jgi:hypothetical protein
MDTYRVIDADGHVLEPPDLFERCIEEPFRRIAPRLVADNHGYERLLVEGLLHPKAEGKAVGITQGFNYGGRQRSTDQRPGGFEPHARIRDSEYFQRQCYISCDPDETTMPQVVEALGEDKVIFASDYPHWDAVFPGAVKEVREQTGLSKSAKRKILGENAARLYGLM